MFDKEAYIILFDHCKLVEGPKFCIIQDNLRKKITRIPTLMYAFLTIYNRKKVSAVIDFSEPNLEEFITYLLNNEFIYLTNEPSHFPPIKDSYESSEIINNCVIEFNNIFRDYYNDISKELTVLGCKHLEIRFYDDISLDTLEELIFIFSNTKILSIDFFLKFGNSLSLHRLSEIIHNNAILGYVVVHSIPVKTIESYQTNNLKTYNNLKLTAEVISSNKHCGVINEKYFSINNSSYQLSKKFNNCLYKKISVDYNGQIKLCPSLKNSFGQIKNTSLVEVVKFIENHENSKITKDKVEVCKVCEYRYACSDCRAYLEDPENIYSKPLKCGYNPHTGEWEEWSTNPLKQKAIEYYGMEELVKEESQATAKPE